MRDNQLPKQIRLKPFMLLYLSVVGFQVFFREQQQDVVSQGVVVSMVNLVEYLQSPIHLVVTMFTIVLQVS